MNYLVTYGGIIVDYSLSEHAGDTSVAAVAPLSTRQHDACGSPARLLERGETRRDIELEVKATATVASLDHNDDRLLVLTCLGQHL